MSGRGRQQHCVYIDPRHHGRLTTCPNRSLSLRTPPASGSVGWTMAHLNCWRARRLAMGAWQDGEVATNGITLHYTRTGGDKPPLVLAHGFSDDGLCWTPVAEALEADYDIVM